ncbi:uncharacterized protein DFL_006254 [Arthrobotrys flagrans]|uniref:DUF676 domain-containing protein n=1 Tax=Arthrobotrys flagrans TaxID=97331 RepID=A0A437A0F2_ARTFL|nr:hypothetical protein DFL_006254 [Arthrobotrys flagrans]
MFLYKLGLIGLFLRYVVLDLRVAAWLRLPAIIVERRVLISVIALILTTLSLLQLLLWQPENLPLKTTIEVLYDTEQDRDTLCGTDKADIRSESKVDLIAVNCLASDGSSAWKCKKTSHEWLRESLPCDFPNSRVLSFHYSSQWKANSPVQTFQSYGLQLLQSLQKYRAKDDTTDRPIIFIGHSFGGLVIKQALILANEPQNKEHYGGSTLKYPARRIISDNPITGRLRPSVRRPPQRLLLRDVPSVNHWLVQASGGKCPTDNEQDISSYIRWRMTKSVTSNKSSQNSAIITSLEENHRGVFLWAHLMLEELENAASYEILDILSQPPPNLRDVYGQALQKRLGDRSTKPSFSTR